MVRRVLLGCKRRMITPELDLRWICEDCFHSWERRYRISDDVVVVLHIRSRVCAVWAVPKAKLIDVFLTMMDALKRLFPESYRFMTWSLMVAALAGSFS